MPGRVLILLAMTSALLSACSSDDNGDSAARTTSTDRADCAMTAAAATMIHKRLAAAPRRTKASTALISHVLTKDETFTSTDVSPGRRDVFILVNRVDGVAGLRGSSGSRSITLSARAGCGAVGYLPHGGLASAKFTHNGLETGSTGPAAD